MLFQFSSNIEIVIQNISGTGYYITGDYWKIQRAERYPDQNPGTPAFSTHKAPERQEFSEPPRPVQRTQFPQTPHRSRWASESQQHRVCWVLLATPTYVLVFIKVATLGIDNQK